MTVLAVAQAISRLAQIPVPAAFVSATSNNQVLLKAIIYKTLDDLRDDYDWPELTRQHLFKTISGLENYPLPADIDRRITDTLWNRSQNWPLIGPIDPILWQQYKSGFITTLPRQRFRVKGIGLNEFYIDPTPSDSDGDQQLVYEYISQSTIRPVTWIANTAYTTAAPYVFYNGLILKCITNGTSANNGQPPQYGIDNTVLWDSVPDYVASQVYYEGQYVYGNSKVYKVTTPGLSSASTPSVASGSETLGTVVFEFQSSAAAWVGGTEYSSGDFASANSHAYRCTADGVSGRLSPKFYDVLPATNGYPPNAISKRIADGTAVWEVYEQPFTEFVADTDEIVLNNDMVVEGALWRFLQAQRLAYDDLKVSAEAKLEACKTKKEGLETISVNMRARYPWAIGVWSYPDGNFGIDS